MDVRAIVVAGLAVLAVAACGGDDRKSAAGSVEDLADALSQMASARPQTSPHAGVASAPAVYDGAMSSDEGSGALPPGT